MNYDDVLVCGVVHREIRLKGRNKVLKIGLTDRCEWIDSRSRKY